MHRLGSTEEVWRVAQQHPHCSGSAAWSEDRWSWKVRAKVLSWWGEFGGQHRLPAAFQALTLGAGLRIVCSASRGADFFFFVYGYSERHTRELSHTVLLFPLSIQVDGPIWTSQNMGRKRKIQGSVLLKLFSSTTGKSSAYVCHCKCFL